MGVASSATGAIPAVEFSLQMHKLKNPTAEMVIGSSVAPPWAGSGGGGYAKDAFSVYYAGQKVIGGVPSSFQALSDGYGKDAFTVYYAGAPVTGAVVSSFEVLGGGYAKDAFSTYYNGVPVSNPGL